MLVRVVAPHFVAGAVFKNGICSWCAPILHKSFFGKTEDECRRVVKAKGWKASIVNECSTPTAA